MLLWGFPWINSDQSVSSAGKGGVTVHTKGFCRELDKGLEGRRSSLKWQWRFLARSCWCIWAGFLGYPRAHVGVCLFCPDLKTLTGNSVSSNFIPSAFSPSCTEGMSWLALLLSLFCELQTFQIIQIICSLTKMDLPVTKWQHTSIDIFRYPRWLMSHRAGWPLIPWSRHSKTNLHFAGVLQDSTLSIH